MNFNVTQNSRDTCMQNSKNVKNVFKTSYDVKQKTEL